MWWHRKYYRLGLELSILAGISAATLLAQEREVDPTWLHRFVPTLSDNAQQSSSGCHYKPIFGEGDAESRILRSVARFAEITLEPRSNCKGAVYDREEEIYFVLQGNGTVHYGNESHALHKDDFLYLHPGVQHSIANSADESLRVLAMGFNIPARTVLPSQSTRVKVMNLNDVKEENVDGHPTSVLYKLLVGPKGAKRDAIDEAFVVTSFFWMDFAPGGTNFPHHHETAEEIYYVLEGEGEMVAGSGVNGIEGRYFARPGDAYYFRPNCTVGFYNRNEPKAKAYILAVRSQIPLPAQVD
jgi:mannose-6-phosphate isomerase-like protein (cupin superfamily)